MHGGTTGLASRLPELLTEPRVLAAMLAVMQVAFGCIGLIGIRRASRKGEPLPPPFPGSHQRAAVIGVAGGLVLLGFRLLYAFALQKLFGNALSSPWASAPVMPTATKLVFLLFGGLGAPLAEELFFRGYMFGKFKAAGYVGLGVLVSSVLFGVVHFSDPYHVPAICLYGALFAWMFHRSGSLLAPVTAHAVNNSVQIAWMVLS